jgi:copper oxidase (laccase) domain-containing protein
VLRATLETMRRCYGSRPDDLRVALGPAIGRCCFEVGDEVVERLLNADPGAGSCILRAPGRRMRVDLIEANRRQALEFGVIAPRIQSTGLCTRCEPDRLESYRRSGPGAGRMAALIAWAA